MPGSRPYEIENMVPFYFAVALRILRERPEHSDRVCDLALYSRATGAFGDRKRRAPAHVRQTRPAHDRRLAAII